MNPNVPSHLAARAMNPAEQWWSAIPADGAERSAASLLSVEAAAGRHQGTVYELFAEMLEKDGHLYSVLQTRTNGLLGLRRAIHPANGTDAARAAAAKVEALLAAIPNLDGLLRALLDALAKGFAAVELLWGYAPDGSLTVVDWIAHRQEFFAFDDAARLLLLAPPFRPAPADPGAPAELPPIVAAGRSILPAAAAIAAPDRKFLAMRFGADARNRYGRGLCQHAYWYYWFKKNNLKYWAIANERFGAPTAIATVPSAMPAEERRRILDILQTLQADNSAVVPESIGLSLLESARSSGASFRELADWCNDEISKIVLGATLTSGEGRRSGSLALGSIHQLVRQDYLEADARLLEETLNATLLRWLAELNAPGAPPPHLRIDTEPPADLNAQADVDRQLLALGVPLPLRYFHERYGRPEPAPGEERLRYDDANLFGYHLRYGVLTVNEVRSRLAMPPVPWGDRVVGEAGGLPHHADKQQSEQRTDNPSRSAERAAEAEPEPVEK